MKFTAFFLVLFGLAGVARASAMLPVEEKVAAVIKSSGVTVVHFWAPWCSNCASELSKNGWSTFIDTNAETNFIFVTTKNETSGHEVLAKNGVGEQKNFQLLLHPNASRGGDTEMATFLGLPMTWLPTTWIFRDGKLRYALNYGEVRFPILQQFVRDTAASW